MNRRAAPHRGLDVHYGDAGQSGDDGQGPSKTQLKQQSADLQALGQALAELPADRLAAIEMPEAPAAARRSTVADTPSGVSS